MRPSGLVEVQSLQLEAATRKAEAAEAVAEAKRVAAEMAAKRAAARHGSMMVHLCACACFSICLYVLFFSKDQ